jgi:hypothetical protein
METGRNKIKEEQIALHIHARPIDLIYAVQIDPPPLSGHSFDESENPIALKILDIFR